MAESNKNGVHGENDASFEQCFRRLQEVVKTLSEGSLTLEEALSSFEEGMRLADTCATMLDEAELRLERVSERVARAAAERVEMVGGQARPVGGADELLAIDVTAYEERIVFSAPPDMPAGGGLGYSPPPGEQSGVSSSQTPAGGKPAAPGKSAGGGKGESLELDPLFDEDE
jgi:exodeoxyribonuclease VII small subunit